MSLIFAIASLTLGFFLQLLHPLVHLRLELLDHFVGCLQINIIYGLRVEIYWLGLLLFYNERSLRVALVRVEHALALPRLGKGYQLDLLSEFGGVLDLTV